MKLQFEPDLPYQQQAIEAVCDLFRGQEICRGVFTVTRNAVGTSTLPGMENDLGIGNRLTLLDDEVLANLNAVQLRNGLAPTEELASADFTVEMETGTGKTYVYLRTIFELNKRYGFTKFVIVVPSVAIREGVYHSIDMAKAHFNGLYAGVPFEYFLYDSTKLGQVRNFATSPNIQIMVATVGAINKKDVNNLYKESEKTGGEKPIDLIRSTSPILIVDEPQSVDGGLTGAGKTALSAMDPLCTLRYSATHADKHHMIYRLDAVDAYERKLVKQIEVAAATVEGGHNRPYVRLVSVSNKKNVITAKVEVDIQKLFGVSRETITVQQGDNLQELAGRDIYRDFRIGEISVAKGGEFMELTFPGGEKWLKPGEAHGDVEAGSIQRQMIKRTIKEHLDKEKRLKAYGIKVLSLFFIDTVEKYRKYDADGNQLKGDYADMFEDEYRRLANHPDYRTLFQEVDIATDAAQVHDGYFSIDRRGSWTNTEENNQTNRDNSERAYNLIMKDKEKLLSFDSKLKFIFSHSALREGWDNPNVFQICALREMGTERERRQTIGRGLRLCVNQQGERQRGFEYNTLTVIANESYEEFADKLQKEIEADTGIRFGIVESHQFATIAVQGEDGQVAPLGTEASKAIFEFLKTAGLVDAKGKIQDSLKTALKNNTLELPEPFSAQLPAVTEILRKLAGRLEVKNADDHRPIKTRQTVLHSAEFKALWDRIKHKTTYRVQFDNEKLLQDCIRLVKGAPPIARTRLQWRRAGVAIGRGGVDATESKTSGAATVALEEGDIELPDILTDLQDRTQLTRRSIYRILVESDRLDEFKRNPQAFIEQTAEIIVRSKRLALVDGIKYQRVGDNDYYAQELFEAEELRGYLNSMIGVEKGVHEQVVYQSETERTFAQQLDQNEAVKVFAKLPGWFKVPTPLGSYNPDWAVLVEKDGEQQLYFVVETKSSLFHDDLRDRESGKIACGKAHFEALAVGTNPARFIPATSMDEVMAYVE